MPIYEYECQKCGEVFEVFQKVSDPPPKKHDCGSKRVKRVLSRSSFVLKGDGWYITDYARKGKKGDDKATDTADKSGSDKKSDKKSKEKSGDGGSGSKASKSSRDAA